MTFLPQGTITNGRGIVIKLLNVQSFGSRDWESGFSPEFNVPLVSSLRDSIRRSGRGTVLSDSLTRKVSNGTQTSFRDTSIIKGFQTTKRDENNTVKSRYMIYEYF